MINIGVIGCGHWGPNHIRTFNGLPGSRVSVVADLDEARLARVYAQFPTIRCERDYRRILDARDVDAVVVATPTSTHFQIVGEAILAGKHVLCEKPLCDTSKRAEELVSLAGSQQRLLMVGHVFLFNNGIVKLKEMVDAQELGRLLYLSASRTNLGPIRSDVNAAWDLASHDIAIFNWLLGAQPDVVSATGATFLQPGIEDVVFISMKYPDNVLVNIQVSWLDPRKVRQITMVGSKRMATWDDLLPTTPIAVYDKGANVVQDYGDFGEFLRLSMWDGDVRLPKVPSDEPLRTEAAQFISYIEQGVVRRSDGAFALGVVRVIEAVACSLAQGGSPVVVPRR